MVQGWRGSVLTEYEEAAQHILEVILKRHRYGSDAFDKIAAYIEKTHRDVDRSQVMREARLLVKNSR